MNSPTSPGTKLAAHRLEPFMASLSRLESDDQVIAKIAKAEYMVSSFATTGPAFDLEMMLSDPSFRLPGRSRKRTEAIVSEGKMRVEELMAISARHQSSRSRETMRRTLIAAIVLLPLVILLGIALPMVLRAL